MLSNTLSQIEVIIQNKLDDVVLNELMDFFKHYKKGMWLYPGVFIRKYNISMECIYEILNEMEKQGIIQSYYELYCSQCQKSNGVVKLFNELPETFECELCNCELPTIENAVIIYQVIKDE